MAQSLAVKYRPKTWEDVIGQETIVQILRQQVETQNIRNCLLFCGASGCGKTTIARVLAKVVNDGAGTPIEIDAASNNGVDNIRDLIAQAKERALDGKYKVIVLDECHSLTNQAWQALLKTIEEPPKYTLFIFCTTDPQKIPETILNRVQRYNFSRIPTDRIKNRLLYVCKQEGFENYVDACDYIAKLANGGMRTALSMLDKCVSLSTNLSIENVEKTLGVSSYETMFSLMNAIIDDEEKTVSEIVSKYYLDGGDLKQFVEQMLSFCLDIEKYCLFKSFDMLTIPSHYKDSVESTINFENADKYYAYIIDKLVVLKNTIRYDTSIRLTVEIAFLQMARGK